MGALREFIKDLDEQGYLRHVQKQVNWNCELGAIALESRTPLLFENIVDYPGRTLFANGLSNYPSIGLLLGIEEKNVGLADLDERVRSSFANPIGPIVKEDPPILENRFTQGIDLKALPVPRWSEVDAGRYIGTWHLNISRDPENGTRNIGVYRMQIVSPNQATVSVSPRGHLARQVAKAEKINNPLPMAVAIGVDERLIIAAAAAPSYGIDEFALAGGLVGRPIELARCMTQPLEVPIDAEIIIEGFVKPRVRVQDGPFLDYAGIPSTNPGAYLFEATALQYRDHYIFRGTAVGRPAAEDHQLYSILAQLGVVDFHGSKIRRFVQSFLFRRRAFRALQFTGKIGKVVRRAKDA